MDYRDAVWEVKGELIGYPVLKVSEGTAGNRHIDPEVAAALRVPEGVTAAHMRAWWRLESVCPAVNAALMDGYVAPRLDELAEDGKPVGYPTYSKARFLLTQAVAHFAAALAALAPADKRKALEGCEWRTARLEGWVWPAEVEQLAKEMCRERDRFAAVAVRYFLGVEEVSR